MPDTATKSISLSAMQTEKARSVRLADKAKRDPVLRKALRTHAEQSDASAAKITELTAALDAANAEIEKLRAELAAALKKAKPAGGQ
jgi:hypothetical protein